MAGGEDMFEPLGRTESEKGTGTGRDMRFVWALVVLGAAVLFTVAFVV
jgi:hypothetical protein